MPKKNPHGSEPRIFFGKGHSKQSELKLFAALFALAVILIFANFYFPSIGLDYLIIFLTILAVAISIFRGGFQSKV